MHMLLLAAALALAAQAGKPEAPPQQPDVSSQPRAEDEGDGIGGREMSEEAANLDFIIVNHTGQTIVELQISPRGEESWSDNLLHYPEVPDQERAAASYSRDVELCRWDIRVRYQGDSRQSWPAVNLCDTVRVELR
jgi:hypothetical protein